MTKLSTGLTILFKMVLPIFWIIFFGSLTVAVVFFAPEGSRIANGYFKWMILLVFLGWTAVLYLTIYQLKRVEGDPDGLYISNYFRHVKIDFQNIQKIDKYKLGLFDLVRIRFVRKTYFGQTIYFIASPRRFGEFTDQYRDVLP